MTRFHLVISICMKVEIQFTAYMLKFLKEWMAKH